MQDFSTSANGLYRLDDWWRRLVDVLIQQLGINDFIRKVPVDHIKYNLEKIIRKTLEKNPDAGWYMWECGFLQRSSTSKSRI